MVRHNNKQISVVVPIYNAEKYLERSLNCILRQSFSSFELLLVDDGSTDRSGLICDSYALKDERIKVFHRQNSGASASRNYGLKQALCPYICFIDADDYQDEFFLETYIDALKEDDYDIVFQNFLQHNEDGSTFKQELDTIIAFTEDDLSEALYGLDYKKCFGWTWNKIFRLSIIKDRNLSFREDFSLREDELFTFQYFKHVKKVKIINTAYYHYFVYGNSLMHRMNDSLKYAQVSESIFDEVQSFVKNKPLLEYEAIKHFENLRAAFFMNYITPTDKKKRICVVKKIVAFYRSHPELAISYNSSIAAVYYKFLFKFCSSVFIDTIVYSQFKIKKHILGN